MSARHGEIRHIAGDEQPVGIFCRVMAADVGHPKIRVIASCDAGAGRAVRIYIESKGVRYFGRLRSMCPEGVT